MEQGCSSAPVNAFVGGPPPVARACTSEPIGAFVSNTFIEVPEDSSSCWDLPRDTHRSRSWPRAKNTKFRAVGVVDPVPTQDSEHYNKDQPFQAGEKVSPCDTACAGAARPPGHRGNADARPKGRPTRANRQQVSRVLESIVREVLANPEIPIKIPSLIANNPALMEKALRRIELAKWKAWWISEQARCNLCN